MAVLSVIAVLKGWDGCTVSYCCTEGAENGCQSSLVTDV